MGLFPSANDFKAGKGVEKDAPRKTGVGRFFELVGRDMNGMFLANLLTCIGFLPVICLVYIGFLMNNLTVMIVSAIAGGILAGPALAGMYDTVLRALRDEAGYWWVTYRRAFKRNFKASIAPGIFYCVVVTAQIFLVYFCFNMLSKGTNVGVPLWVATVLNLLINGRADSEHPWYETCIYLEAAGKTLPVFKWQHQHQLIGHINAQGLKTHLKGTGKTEKQRTPHGSHRHETSKNNNRDGDKATSTNNGFCEKIHISNRHKCTCCTGIKTADEYRCITNTGHTDTLGICCAWMLAHGTDF